MLRGAAVMSVKEKCPELSDVTIEVQFDGSQYQLDLMKLAVEESMFVQESYQECQIAIKMSTETKRTTDQLHSLINLA